MNLQNPKESSDRLVTAAKRFLKLPDLNMVIKQKSLAIPRSLALGTFGKFLWWFQQK